VKNKKNHKGHFAVRFIEAHDKGTIYCYAFIPKAHDKGNRLSCVFSKGARQRQNIAVRFLPAHDKGRNVPLVVGAVSCFSLPCASL
jgi:hypothetical protein